MSGTSASAMTIPVTSSIAALATSTVAALGLALNLLDQLVKLAFQLLYLLVLVALHFWL